MTTLVALRGVDCIIMATDSRETELHENQQVRTHRDDVQKLENLCGNVAYMRHGAAIQQADRIKDQYVHWLSNDSDGQAIDQTDIEQVVESFSSIAHQIYNRWTAGTPATDLAQSRSRIEIALVGYTNAKEQRIYYLDSNARGTRFFPSDQGNCYVGGVDAIGMYWCKRVESLLGTGLPRESLLRLAAFILRETGKVHDMVGGPSQLAIVTPEQFEKIEPTEAFKFDQEAENALNKSTMLSWVLGR